MENKNVNTTTQNDNQKSIIITIAIYSGIVLLLFFIRFWPPYNKTEALIAEGGGGGGVTVNFGDSEMGKGDDYLSETLEVNMQQPSNAASETAPEEILTQDNTGEAINTPPKTTKPKEKTLKDTKPVTVAQPVKKPNSALSNMLKGKNKGGDGDDNTNGNKGKNNGKLNSDGYYGNGGSGGGAGGGNGKGNGDGDGDGNGKGSGNGSGGGASYNLAGRRVAKVPEVGNDCNSFGKVVIEVIVDQAGKTISASNGKGTKADACLIALAKQYALKTKWQPSPNAAEKQTGTITYNFKNQ